MRSPFDAGALPPGRGAEGFTLLELLVVLAMMGLALALVAPNVGAGSAGAALAADARGLTGGLRLARERAVLTEREVAFTLDAATGRWRVEGADAGGTLSGRAALAATTEAGDVGRGGVIVRFFPDGAATGAEFVLSVGDRRRTVRVDWLTGRVAEEASDG